MFKERQLMTTAHGGAKLMAAAHGGAETTAGHLCRLFCVIFTRNHNGQTPGKPLLLCSTSLLHPRTVGLKIRRCGQRMRKQWSIRVRERKAQEASLSTHCSRD